MFGFFKKKEYTLLTSEMMEPQDAAIPTTEAKKIYRAHMKAIGLFPNDELSDRVYEFGEEIKYREEEIRDDIQDYKDEIRRIKDEIKDLSRRLKTCSSEEEKEELTYDLEAVNEELVSANEELENEKTQLKYFRSDKREFLIKYVNDEIKNETRNH